MARVGCVAKQGMATRAATRAIVRFIGIMRLKEQVTAKGGLQSSCDDLEFAESGSLICEFRQLIVEFSLVLDAAIHVLNPLRPQWHITHQRLISTQTEKRDVDVDDWSFRELSVSPKQDDSCYALQCNGGGHRAACCDKGVGVRDVRSIGELREGGRANRGIDFLVS
jgi:hypothetical protein